MSRKAVYIIVFNTSKPNLTRIAYWLHLVKTISVNTPIIIVGTHLGRKKRSFWNSNGVLDKFNNSERKEVTDNLAKKIKKLRGYSLVKAILFLSCTRQDDVNRLMKIIVDIVGSHAVVKKTVPKFYALKAKVILVFCFDFSKSSALFFFVLISFRSTFSL